MVKRQQFLAVLLGVVVGALAVEDTKHLKGGRSDYPPAYPDPYRHEYNIPTTQPPHRYTQPTYKPRTYTRPTYPRTYTRPAYTPSTSQRYHRPTQRPTYRPTYKTTYGPTYKTRPTYESNYYPYAPNKPHVKQYEAAKDYHADDVPREPCGRYPTQKGSKLAFKLNPDRLCPVDECNAATYEFLRDSCSQEPPYSHAPPPKYPRERKLRSYSHGYSRDSSSYSEYSSSSSSSRSRSRGGYGHGRGGGYYNPFCRYEVEYQAVASFKDGKFICPTDSDLLLVKNGFCYNAYFQVVAGDAVEAPAEYQTPYSSVCGQGYGEPIWWVTSCKCTNKPVKRECRSCPAPQMPPP